MIDAIPNEAIKAQYAAEAAYFKKAGLTVSDYINPSMWNAEANDFASGAFYTTFGRDAAKKSADGTKDSRTQNVTGGVHADGTPFDPNTTDLNKKIVKRYTYALTRGSLQDGPGANAIWNITNVTRQDRPLLYTTEAWAQKMSEDPEVIAAIKKDPSSPYYADGTDEGIKNAVRVLLNPYTNQFDNNIHNFPQEQSMDDYYAFMVWHRGLAIPRARNLNDQQVQKVKNLSWEGGVPNGLNHIWKQAPNNYTTSKNMPTNPFPPSQNKLTNPI